MLQAPEPVPAPVYKFTRACLPANLRAGIKLPLSCIVVKEKYVIYFLLILKEMAKYLLELVITQLATYVSVAFIRVQLISSTAGTAIRA